MRKLKKVWLIDDDEDERVLVELALKAAKLEVEFEFFRRVEEATDALASLERNFPELIVCDYKLPARNGLDFLDWIRASPYRVIPVVIRSNSDSQKDVDAAYSHGANCYVQK